MKRGRGGQAVTEIISAILLLAMTVAAFSVIYSNVLSDNGPEAENYTTISGTLSNENGDDLQDIVFNLDHGEFLGSDTEVVLDIGQDKTFHVTVEENPDMAQNDNNEYWNIGDRFVYHPKYEDGTLINLDRLNIKASIIDKKTNSLVFWGILQEGWSLKDNLGGIWHFDEPYEKYSGTEKDVLDDLNDNHGIAMGGTSHKLKKNPSDSNDDVVSGIGSCFFPGIKGSDVMVEDHYSLNIQDEMTIEAWMKPFDEGFIRTTSDFDAQFGKNPDVVNVCGDIYAIAADGKSGSSEAGCAIAATVRIKGNGTTEEIIDENNPLIIKKPGEQPDIIKVSEDAEYTYFAVVYNGGAKTSYSGFIKIIKINKATGIIDGLFDEKPEAVFNTPACWPDITNINNDFYAITYSEKTRIDENGKIYFQTIHLDVGTGVITTISKEPIDSLGNDPNILKISETIFAIVYRHSNSGYITTIEIDPTTCSIVSVNDPEQFDDSCKYPDIIYIEGNTYAVVYGNFDGDKGLITTMDIDPISGDITFDKVIGKEFDPDGCLNPDIINVKDDLYAIVYSIDAPGQDNGRIVKLSISDYGTNIYDIVLIVDSFYDPIADKFYPCYTPVLAKISEHIVAVIYRSGGESGGPHRGEISTFCLVEYSETPFERGIFKSGSVNIYAIKNPHGAYPPGIYASVKIFDVVSEEETEYQLYTPDMITNDWNDWNHIALTFDGTNIYLYCNGQLEDAIGPLENPENKILKTSNADLLFGYLFFGLIDEIAIHDEALNSTDVVDHYNDPGTFEEEP